MLDNIPIEWRDLLDIGVVSVLLYQLIQLVRGSRALAVLTGLGVLTLLFFFAKAMGLYTLNCFCSTSSVPFSSLLWSFFSPTSGRLWAKWAHDVCSGESNFSRAAWKKWSWPAWKWPACAWALLLS